jgi:serine/threonine-protein kinase HipA
MYNEGAWKLTPAYDLTFAYNPESYWLKNHNININGKNNNITTEDLAAVGEKFSIKKAENIISQIKEIVHNFDHYANLFQYPKEKTLRIRDVLQKRTKKNLNCLNYKLLRFLSSGP